MQQAVPAAIRLACETDAESVSAIYAPFVAGTAISFEIDPPGATEMRRRIGATLQRWPWLVCERDGALRGYAYAGEHRERAAYQWCADVSVYVDTAAHRSGVGRALYTALLRILLAQGFHNAYAGITLPNAASVGLHESLGFEPVGVYRDVGFKLGRWHDVGWWQLRLLPPAPDPDPPRPLRAVAGWPQFAEALRTGEQLLRR